MANPPENRELASAGTEAEKEHSPTSGEHINRSSAPIHPIPQLQGPFEESIYEAVQGTQSDWEVDLDARTRRQDLLENPKYERLCGRKWRQRADERFHPFWKLTAQMSFGLHLIVKEMAKSDAEVLRILQTHVDEVDGFISRTTEDFLIIQIDLRTRIQYLSLPLQNLNVFDEMLEDRSFRLAMIDYNEKIEHAIARFTAAVEDSLKDIQKGKEAIGSLWHYIGQSAKEQAPLPSSLAAIYNSMLANTEGWNTTFSKLGRKGVAIQSALVQLDGAVAEMQRRVGVASRKDLISFITPSYATPRAKSFRERLFDRSSYVSSPALEKPLPCDPGSRRASESRPSSRSHYPRRMTQKSVPNLRAIQESDKFQSHEPPSARAKSVNGGASYSGPSAFIPKIQKKLSRRFSMVKTQAKESPVELGDAIPNRPSTAASRTLRSFQKSRPELQQQQRPSPPLPQARPQRPSSSNKSTKHETMRNQLMHYIKSDKVLDTWESMKQKEKREDRPTKQRRVDGLWSKFQARSSSMPSDEIQTSLTHDDIQKQMAWLQEETKALNTYSLKPKHDVAPKLHIFSVQMNFHRELDEKESYIRTSYPKSIAADAESIITALPSIPAPLTIPDPPSDSMECFESTKLALDGGKDQYLPRIQEKSVIVS